MSLEALCRPVKLILSDVDGVMTDGGIVFDNQGIEIKRFHVRDGLAIKLWQRAGGKFGIVTSRNSHIVRLRATELGIDIVRQGFDQKLPAAREVIAELGLSAESVAYIGDDLPDVPVMNAVGLAIAVADACSEAKAAAAYVTNTFGGHGAVREAIEFILKTQQRWDEVVQKYVS